MARIIFMIVALLLAREGRKTLSSQFFDVVQIAHKLPEG